MTLFASLLLSLTICGSIGIKLIGHRYEDVYIVIQNTVAEDPEIIDNIKETFTTASSLLFKATHRRVYFGKINIVIPKEWTNIPNTKQIPSIKLPNFILVDKGQNENPFVKSTECGKEGLYMYLHPSFLLKKGETGYGRKDKVIVHEWGHLRWGLFSEYHSSRKNKFYLDKGRWKPTVCTENIQGRIGIGKFCSTVEEKCQPQNGERRMPSNCNFCPYREQTTNVSIMGYQFVESVNFFCDKDDTSVPVWQRHNHKAPTKQNLLCNGKSAWEVMREHSDFKNGNTPLPDNTNTDPEFVVLKETNAIRVFVLDISGSMNTEDRIGHLYRTSTYIVDSVLPLDSWLGVVCFDEKSKITAQMTKISSDSVRKTLIQSLPSQTAGGTCIGCGITEAINMLNSTFGTAENAEIILMSDGQDGDAGMLASATRLASESHVIIHTVSISQAADPRMIDLAKNSGGKIYTYLDKGSISFAAVFSQVISFSVTEMSAQPETMLFMSVSVPNSAMNFAFKMETDSGLNTTITVLTKLASNAKLTMEVTGPGSTNFKTVDGTSLTYQIPGVLKVNVTSSQATTWDYTVSSMPTGSNQIKSRTRLSQNSFDFNGAPTDMPVVYADITKGYAPVTGVDVFAIVEGAKGLLCNLSLTDDGLGPDQILDDGTYSAFILPVCMENNRLNLRVRISGSKGRARVQIGGSGAIATEEPDITYEDLEDDFQRFSIPEPLFVQNLPNNLNLPPGRITDLSIVHMKTRKTAYGESRNFTIAWTATGGDMNMGKASAYDIRIAEDIDTILNNFTNAQKFEVGNVTLSPKPSGSAEAIRISVNAVESYTGTAFLGIVAIDENQKAGQVSNVVSFLVAKGFRIQVEEVAYYTHGLFDGKTDEVDGMDKKTVNQQPSLVANVLIVFCLVAMLSV
ncbi:hypothetical protein DPMN_143807 [Dreissena polymorpha]|uniref:VWFA domain-containing protein n=1 Tax=Dreissena polymorpha TaxID=45954 RepID=A0A9D4JKC9_DREPO|nr:hypothetical protein DPMN_143807 [Dreissena polymorpha]